MIPQTIEQAGAEIARLKKIEKHYADQGDTRWAEKACAGIPALERRIQELKSEEARDGTHQNR